MPTRYSALLRGDMPEEVLLTVDCIRHMHTVYAYSTCAVHMLQRTVPGGYVRTRQRPESALDGNALPRCFSIPTLGAENPIYRTS